MSDFGHETEASKCLDNVEANVNCMPTKHPETQSGTSFLFSLCGTMDEVLQIETASPSLRSSTSSIQSDGLDNPVQEGPILPTAGPSRENVVQQSLTTDYVMGGTADSKFDSFLINTMSYA